MLIAQLPSCPVAQLPSCPVAQLPSCPVAQLPSCPVAKLPSCQVAKLPSCQVAKLPSCQGAKVPRCQGAKVPRCQGAKVPRCQGARGLLMQGCWAVVFAQMWLGLGSVHPIFEDCAAIKKFVGRDASRSQGAIPWPRQVTRGSRFVDNTPKGTCIQSSPLLLCSLRRRPVCASSTPQFAVLWGGFVSMFAPLTIG